jgi:hypothetical protein
MQCLVTQNVHRTSPGIVEDSAQLCPRLEEANVDERAVHVLDFDGLVVLTARNGIGKQSISISTSFAVDGTVVTSSEIVDGKEDKEEVTVIIA